MSELVEAIPSHVYGELIREVFIKPIRTVMVVDDQFPTLEDCLQEVEGLDVRKAVNKKLVQGILDVCRDTDHSWLVDVHDGSSQSGNEVAIASHLQHSDLMILDYHLDRLSDKGDKAIQILKELAKNAHLNLVIVYTAAGDGVGGDINKTVWEIALGLTCKDTKLEWIGQGLTAFEKKLDQWGDFVPNILNRLVEEIDLTTFLRIRWADDRSIRKEVVKDEFQGFKALVESASDHGLEIDAPQALKWALHKAQQNWSESLSSSDLGKVTVGISDDGKNWIRTNGLFVTVISKLNAPKELPSMLSTALEYWDPLPQRLILSKIRAELDATGAMAEDEILSNRYLQAGWLNDFLSDIDGISAGRVTVDRHWESLGDTIRPKVMEYSHQLAKSLSQRTDVGTSKFEGLIPLDIASNHSLIGQHANSYACTKRIDGNHLSVGHILDVNRGDPSLRYWICLTPACDLVPGQKSESGWGKRLGEWMSFKAVQLFPATVKEALENAASSNYLFLEVDGEMKIFCFSPTVSSNPKWEQMFAKNEGVFGDEKRDLTISLLSGEADGISAKEVNGRVVAQLRYEYALNLLQRLGINLSRIGLDFKSY